MTGKSKAAIAVNLKSVLTEGTDVLNKVSGTSKELSLEGTATLVGSFGGCIGLSAAYGLVIVVPAISFAIAGPIALGLGITGGLLAFRGTSAAKLDREMDNRRRAGNYFLEQIKQLPKSAPKQIRDGLYLQYHKVITNSDLDGQASMILLGPKKDIGDQDE